MHKEIDRKIRSRKPYSKRKHKARATISSRNWRKTFSKSWPAIRKRSSKIQRLLGNLNSKKFLMQNWSIMNRLLTALERHRTGIYNPLILGRTPFSRCSMAYRAVPDRPSTKTPINHHTMISINFTSDFNLIFFWED